MSERGRLNTLALDGVQVSVVQVSVVQVGVGPRSGPVDPLFDLVVAATSAELSSVVLGHRCPRCGSADHGRPILLRPASASPISLSRSRTRSRSGDFEAAAVSTAGAIGVDIESSDAVTAHDVDAALLHPRERIRLAELPPVERARAIAELWSAKEALAKATGHGVRIDFRDLNLHREGAGMIVEAWPAELGLSSAPIIRMLVVDAALVGAVALVPS